LPFLLFTLFCPLRYSLLFLAALALDFFSLASFFSYSSFNLAYLSASAASSACFFLNASAAAAFS